MALTRRELIQNGAIGAGALAVGGVLGKTLGGGAAVQGGASGLSGRANEIALERKLSPDDVSRAVKTFMLSIGVVISVLAGSRVKALSIAILTWFGLVLVYDLAAIGVAVAVTSSGWSLLVATLLNPVEAIRILAVLGLEPDLHVLGPMGAYLLVQFGAAGSTMLLAVATVAWIVIPLAGAAALLRQQDA